MAYQENGSSTSAHIFYFTEAFLLKLGVSDSQDFINNKNLGLEVGCDGKR